MYIKIRYNLFIFKRFLIAKVYGVGTYGRRVPKVGDSVDACCSAPSSKIVARVDHRNDSIEYTDGTSDSIWHCGWVVDKGERK